MKKMFSIFMVFSLSAVAFAAQPANLKNNQSDSPIAAAWSYCEASAESDAPLKLKGGTVLVISSLSAKVDQKTGKKADVSVRYEVIGILGSNGRVSEYKSDDTVVIHTAKIDGNWQVIGDYPLGYVAQDWIAKRQSE